MVSRRRGAQQFGRIRDPEQLFLGSRKNSWSRRARFLVSLRRQRFGYAARANQRRGQILRHRTHLAWPASCLTKVHEPSFGRSTLPRAAAATAGSRRSPRMKRLEPVQPHLLSAQADIDYAIDRSANRPLSREQLVEFRRGQGHTARRELHETENLSTE